MSCDLKFFPEDCSGGDFGGLVFLAVVSLLTVILVTPFMLWREIQRHKPKPKHFDAEGRERVGGYTLADYRYDLSKDINPYKILYDGYERDWAFYKVISLFMKAMLVLPVVLFVNTNQVGDRDDEKTDKSLLLIQSIWALAVLSIYCILSGYSEPFIKDSDDRSDQVARFGALGVAACGKFLFCVFLALCVCMQQIIHSPLRLSNRRRHFLPYFRYRP